MEQPGQRGWVGSDGNGRVVGSNDMGCLPKGRYSEPVNSRHPKVVPSWRVAAARRLPGASCSYRSLGGRGVFFVNPDFHVASMSHGVAGSRPESLILLEKILQHARHEKSADVALNH